MNKFLRTTLIAGLIALPTAAFAQPVTQIDERQVEMVAYEVGGADSPQMATHTAAAIGINGAHANASPAELLRPGYDAGLTSIYLRH
ncbi:hypothetical protein B0G75_101534 [Paraburkholderia sp. BL18I3N2]|uniref:hypothetical protein n=1 Tax=Paraburkholderia sp. BL18I3N2 TaxID=1938799 RepID=UPI000D06C998|nr:hypothetical protein [Paraburkholderia sp. BL18I3N2]PRX36345.1 hypothetical protein B0G75_101534 [Paraburkholderia sp. BL18I3N2]